MSQKTQPKPGGQDESKLARAMRRNVDWEKDDVQDVFYWARQVVSLLIGLVWGLIPMTGFVGHVGYVIVSGVLLFMYYSKYLNVDEEVFGRWDMFTEGFMPGYGLFVLIWISVYSLTFTG